MPGAASLHAGLLTTPWRMALEQLRQPQDMHKMRTQWPEA